MDSVKAKTIARLERLVTDLEHIVSGTISVRDLGATSVIENWTHSLRRVPCLAGSVEGHPLFRNGAAVVTSEPYAHFHSGDEHFARTLSRWYRLGSRAQAGRFRGRTSGAGSAGSHLCESWSSVMPKGAGASEA